MTENRDGNQYLEKVEVLLKRRIDELKDTLTEGQKEIEQMHDYYWENYTEMDQYGYEDYDNRQALLNQVNANQENLKRKRKLEKMLDSPFFGRVDFCYEGDEEPEIFYIGIGNFAEEAGGQPLIYDWRAPVCSLFYDYDKGPASYEAPMGTMSGEIFSKWQYKVRNGKMVYAFESDIRIDDEILGQELGSNGDVHLKNIIRTIQKEQNAIIRNTGDRILVIQGAAGSGKTSIALHRIAYLLYRERGSLKSSHVLILSPNSVFSDYISHILPELGEENIQEMSFDLFAYRELRDLAADCEDRYDWLERQMAGVSAEETERVQRKQSEAFVGEAEGFLALLEDRLLDFRPVAYKGMELSEQELIQLFYFKFQDTPLLARMQAVMDYFVDAYETLHDVTLPEEELFKIQAKFEKLYVTRDVYKIYNWLMEDCGWETLPDVPPEKRFLRYEDVYPLLYLKYRLQGRKAHRNIRHLVIDEMQDYSYLQYVILSDMFSCKMTILGDRAQTLDGSEQNVLRFLPKLLDRKLRKIVLNKSYRNTMEIAEYAASLTGVDDLEVFARHGKPVSAEGVCSLEEAVQKAAGQVQLGEGGYETAAFLTRTAQEAKEAQKLLEAKGIQAVLVDRDSTSFPRGMAVTTFYLAKGLEFDQVFAVTPEGEDAFLKQVRYICATRALHELYMYEIKK